MIRSEPDGPSTLTRSIIVRDIKERSRIWQTKRIDVLVFLPSFDLVTKNWSCNISSYLLKCIHFPALWETRLRWRWTLESLRPGQSSGLLYEIKRNYFLFNFERICYGLCYHNERAYVWNYTDYKSNFTVVTDPLGSVYFGVFPKF